MEKNNNANLKEFQLSILFLITRLLLVISIPLEGLKSYGDYWNFYHMASLGRPFLDLWVEFPPFFPVLSRGIFLIVGGREHSYIYALIVIFSIFQAVNIYLFQKITTKINPDKGALNRVMVYVFLITGLFYGWAYFDSIAVFFLLFGIYLVLKRNSLAAGVVIGVGGLVKWFPILILPAAWKWLGAKKAILVGVIVVVIVALGWGLLYGLSPEYTKASLISQGAKGSWETVWALIDGNLGTGNFSSDADRTVAASASIASGKDPVIPSWLSLLIFGGIGFIVFLKANIDSPGKLVCFTGFTLIFFLLWSPGYSPQWILYLLPFLLMCFTENRSILLALVMVMINLLEWPVLLSRGLFQYLDEVVLLRTAILFLMAFLFGQRILENDGKERIIN